MNMLGIHGNINRHKTIDHYFRKVNCPQCRVRLMDIHSQSLKHSAALLSSDNMLEHDFSIKCPKCKSVIGITFERS